MSIRSAALASFVLLAACGGSGDNGSTLSAGAVAPPTTGTPTPSPSPTPTPTPTGQANMFDVAAAASFTAVGSLHSLSIDENGSSLYRGDAATVAQPSGQISYDPRDGVFTLKLDQSKAGVTREVRFQDPSHRSTADSARVGEYQVPLLSGFNYLQALDGDAVLTFFYKRPGANSAFVSLGGFERSTFNEETEAFSSEQGVFAFGVPSATSQLPTGGSGRFEGEFLATMVGQIGSSNRALQWISGTSGVDVNFAARTLDLSLSGTVGPAYVKDDVIPAGSLAIKPGSIFSAQGTASWLAAANAFSGKFSTAGFTMNGVSTAIDFTSVSAGGSVAGASSIDGAFYGPDAQNVGGNFRIVGGVPDQRVDILGAFIGAKR